MSNLVVYTVTLLGLTQHEFDSCIVSEQTTYDAILYDIHNDIYHRLEAQGLPIPDEFGVTIKAIVKLTNPLLCYADQYTF